MQDRTAADARDAQEFSVEAFFTVSAGAVFGRPRDMPQSPRSVGFGTSDGTNDQGSVRLFLLIRHEMDALGISPGTYTLSKTRSVDH